MCNRIFNQSNALDRHAKTCCTDTIELFPGGKFKVEQTLFERLEDYGYNVKEQDRYCKFISVYDYESILRKKEEMIKGRKTQSFHVPATFSVCSNIPGYTEPEHVTSDGSPQKLVDKMVQIQLKHQEVVSKIMREKFQWVIDGLEQDICKNPENVKKYQTLLNSLLKYCDQLVVVGFNSQKYDIPLIKRYLPSSLQSFDSLPKCIIKKGNSYMLIATKRLKYLDLTNYLAAGTSLENFYKSYNVTTPKGQFCYSWFDDLSKLNHPSLPEKHEFFNLLKDKSISDEDYQTCWNVWYEQGMKTFGDYVRYYNNRDVLGLVEGIEKMLEIEKQNGLDVFKESVSLPGLTQKYLFRNLKGDYFTNFSSVHEHIYRQLRKLGITGGASVIFHRHQKVGETLIKNHSLCQTIIGYDANSLYLGCTGEEMPTGYYKVREKTNGYKREMNYSEASIQWLEHVAEERGIHIRHALNSPHGEKRIDNFSVDGFCEATNTVFEYYGCYFHGHDICGKYDQLKEKKTIEREKILKELGYNVETIFECEWPKSFKRKNIEPVQCTFSDMKNAILDDESFGIVKCSVHVPKDKIEHFSEFPVIFKNTKIDLDDVGEHMQAHCKSINRKKGVSRSLISSMKGDGIVILTPLFKKYMELGLICTDIEWIIEYNPKRVFEWFVDEVVTDRRRSDLDPDWKVRGETSKTKGNSCYGYSIIDKSKHKNISFVSEENIENHIKNPLLKDIEVLNGDIYQVEKTKKKIVHDMPIQIGISVYSYAKLNLINFWEFINYYLVFESYQIMMCDTDSLYFALLAHKSIDACVKPDLLEEWSEKKGNSFHLMTQVLLGLKAKLCRLISTTNEVQGNTRRNFRV